MKVRSFYTKIWNDEFFLTLSSTKKLLFIYYVFNARVNIIYCYECSDTVTKFETSVSQDIISSGKKEFQGAGKLAFFRNYIFVANGERYQTFRGEKLLMAKRKLIGEMSPLIRDWFNNISDRGIDTPIDTPSIGSKTKTKTSININTNNKEEKVREFLNLFNEIWGSKFSSTRAIESNFDYWLEEYTLKDMELAIRGGRVHRFYKDKLTPEMLLRRKNQQGEGVDRIGELKNTGSPQRRELKSNEYWGPDGKIHKRGGGT